MKLTGEICTTPSGLSEGILWDFKKNGLASLVLEHYGFDKNLIPDIAPTFSLQGQHRDRGARQHRGFGHDLLRQ
jgi:xylulokinase